MDISSNKRPWTVVVCAYALLAACSGERKTQEVTLGTVQRAITTGSVRIGIISSNGAASPSAPDILDMYDDVFGAFNANVDASFGSDVTDAETLEDFITTKDIVFFARDLTALLPSNAAQPKNPVVAALIRYVRAGGHLVWLQEEHDPATQSFAGNVFPLTTSSLSRFMLQFGLSVQLGTVGRDVAFYANAATEDETRDPSPMSLLVQNPDTIARRAESDFVQLIFQAADNSQNSQSQCYSVVPFDAPAAGGTAYREYNTDNILPGADIRSGSVYLSGNSHRFSSSADNVLLKALATLHNAYLLGTEADLKALDTNGLVDPAGASYPCLNDGSSDGTTLAGATTPAFQLPRPCGDGILDSVEECEDGNSVGGDGCSPRCEIETDFGCSYELLFEESSAASGDSPWTFTNASAVFAGPDPLACGNAPNGSVKGATWVGNTSSTECAKMDSVAGQDTVVRTFDLSGEDVSNALFGITGYVEGQDFTVDLNGTDVTPTNTSRLGQAFSNINILGAVVQGVNTLTLSLTPLSSNNGMQIHYFVYKAGCAQGSLNETCNVDNDCASGLCDTDPTVAVCACDGNEDCGPGKVCDTSEVPNACEPVGTCGNNILEPDSGEGCDDGNTVSGDGCSFLCSTADESSCNDTVDNDADGWVDIADTDCITLAEPADLTVPPLGTLDSCDAALHLTAWTIDDAANVPGATGVMGDLTTDTDYPANPASEGTFTAYNFVDGAENTGYRLRGFLAPTQSGTYGFRLQSTNASQLWLSTSVDPEDRKLIADQITQDGNAVSGTTTGLSVSLTGGQFYYVEIYYIAGVSGTEDFSISWNRNATGFVEVPLSRFVRGLEDCNPNCGNSTVETELGEGCDPPNPGTCTDECKIAAGQSCTTDIGCETAYCDNNTNLCAVPSCTDSAQNQNETDVDCGGSCPDKCADGLACLAPADCVSDACVGNACVSCTDSTQNGNETDVDCGGSCPDKCDNGQGCASGTDCESDNCDGNVCAAASGGNNNGGNNNGGNNNGGTTDAGTDAGAGITPDGGMDPMDPMDPAPTPDGGIPLDEIVEQVGGGCSDCSLAGPSSPKGRAAGLFLCFLVGMYLRRPRNGLLRRG